MRPLPGGACCLLLTTLLVTGCANRSGATAVGPTVLSEDVVCSSVSSDHAAHVLAMNPDLLAEADLMILRNFFPVPRIIAINGSLPVVSMDSFAGFLTAMGYPEEKIRNPLNGARSYSSYLDSARLAGMVAWYYEKDGVMPILIGHSQGGMLVVRLLYELSGDFRRDVEVWDPYADRAEGRTTIIDPINGHERPVIGLKAGLASAIATGKVMRLLLGQWDMLRRLRQIPDSVAEFTGYHLPHDPISGTIFGVGNGDWYRPAGSAFVRNVVLPDDTGHLTVILAEPLAQDRGARQWIAAYDPDRDMSMPLLAKGSGSPLFAADIWHRIKAAWCREVQDWIISKRRVCEAVSSGR